MNKKIGEQLDEISELAGTNKLKDYENKKLAKGEKTECNNNTVPVDLHNHHGEKEEFEQIHSSNLTFGQNILENAKTDLEDAKKRKCRQTKNEDLFCETCELQDKTKLLDCYLCKKIKCKSCAGKEPQYSSKRRDLSSYICEDCMNKDSNKMRKKQGLTDFQGISTNDSNQYINDLNNNNNNNMNLRKNLRVKPLLIEDQEINRKLEESKKNERDEILNLDILYECLSPPSDLNGEYEITTKITKSNLSNNPTVTKKKRRRTKNYLDLNFNLVCHQCLKCNPKVEYYRCARADCGKYYCNKCIRKYSSLGNIKHTNRINKTLNFCYSCRKICKCLTCQKEYSTIKSNNFVHLDMDNLDGNKNIVKIDDYVILENGDADEDFTEEKEGESYKEIYEAEFFNGKINVTNEDNRRELKETTPMITLPSNLGNTPVTTEDEKIRNCVKAVENSRNLIKTNKIQRCIMCSNESNNQSGRNSLKFKSLEEFILYLKFFYSQITVSNDQEYAQSQCEYNDYLTNYFKNYYSDSDYIFKSIKTICRECFTSGLKVKNGFYNLFSSLHIGHNLTNKANKVAENKQRNNLISGSEKNNVVEHHEREKDLTANNIHDCHNNPNSSEKKFINKNMINISLNNSNNANNYEILSSNPNFNTNNNNINKNNNSDNFFQNNVNQSNDANSIHSKNSGINSSLFSLNKFSNNTGNNYSGHTNILNPTQNTRNNVMNVNNTNNINRLYEMFSNMRQNQTNNSPNGVSVNNMLRNIINQSLTNNHSNNLNLGTLSSLHNLINNNADSSNNTQNNQSYLEMLGSNLNNNIENELTNRNIQDTHNTTGNNQNNINTVDNLNNGQHENNAEKENFMSLVNNLNPEALNVTNIIMNIDNNGKNMGGCSSNVLDELKKQFFCIQYYSLLQKLFISYIFKNLELFIEQISKNQLLGEYIVNNIANSIPKSSNNNSETNSNELQIMVHNINDQMSLLKNINHYGVILTNALSSNFEDLKCNGVKIFKAMDPSIQLSVVTNLNYLVNNLSELNPANVPNASNGFLTNQDIFNKSVSNNNNNTNGNTNVNRENTQNNHFININNLSNNNSNNVINPSCDSLLHNFHTLINNLNNNNNNQQGQSNLNSNQHNSHTNTNNLLSGLNPLSHLTQICKNLTNTTMSNSGINTGLNPLNNIYNNNQINLSTLSNPTNLGNLSSLSNLGGLNPSNTSNPITQLNQAIPLGQISNNLYNTNNSGSNRPINVSSQNSSQGIIHSINSSMNITPQMISEILSQSNIGSNLNNQMNLMNIMATLNKSITNPAGIMGATTGSNDSNTNIATNPNNPNLFNSFQGPPNNSLFMSMIGMNSLQSPHMNQQINNMGGNGKEMNGIHTMNNQNNESVDNENNLKSQSHTNIINNINQQMEQGKSTHDINQNNLDHELNQNNFSNDIEIEKIDEDKIPPETSKVKNKEN